MTRRSLVPVAIGLCLWTATAHAGDGSGGAPALENPVARQPLQTLSTTLARPLFAPSRREAVAAPAPVARAEPPAPSPRPQAPSVTLFGIMTDRNGSEAVLRSGGSVKDARVRVGDDVGGWKVSGIDERRLILTLEDRSVSVDLFARKGQADSPGLNASAERRLHAGPPISGPGAPPRRD
ncbi:MAG TPA: hypothetical protein VKS78_06000 [Roseiarcus sp.]|nr:hypothetical protein [Roseiarcus sp.]